MNLTKEEKKIKENLPHLFGMPHYTWSKKFFDATNKFCFLVAANQIGKSSAQIRKCIDWATNKKKWPKLWRTTPQQFWYLYPNKITATGEYENKWVPEFLPRGDMKDDLVFGWEPEYRGKDIYAIHFRSGCSVYFKTYSQDVHDLQTATVHAIWCDEELPFSMFQELRSRIAATNGYFSMVYTATLGQDEWRRTMEPGTLDEELFKEAFKLTVSMYDCVKYVDGTSSHWTIDRIKEIEAECSTEAEIQKRVFGRFVVSGGLKYASFSRSKNLVPKFRVPEDWSIYTGVDIGTGGEKNHPAAITFIACKPDYTEAVVFQGWRGDGIITTPATILQKHQELCMYEGRKLYPVLRSYDWHSKDFFNIASVSGVAFTPADKGRDRGEQLLNTLFSSGMLRIFDGDPELGKLVQELSSLLNSKAKTSAKDDFIDSLRYCAGHIPWNFRDAKYSVPANEEKVVLDTRTPAQKHWEDRLPGIAPESTDSYNMEEVFSEWQEYIDG